MDGELGEEGALGEDVELVEDSVEGDDGELGEDGEELGDMSALTLLEKSELVVLEAVSALCENVPRLAVWSRVSSSACPS